MEKAVLLWLILFPFWGYSQFVDDFSDGNFTENPIWLGDVDNFGVNTGELQLFDEDVSHTISQLYTNVLVADSTNWSMYVRMAFSPSSSNFSKIYLQSDQSDLTGPLNGYFLKIGGISGSDDAVELYRQTGTEETLLIRGMVGAVGNDPAIARLSVRRNNSGVWELWADYTGGTDYVLQGTSIDQTHPTGSYMGVVCQYTATRFDLFFFDDFMVRPLFIDTNAPQAVSVSPISPMEIDVLFDEPIDAPSVQASAFSLSGGLMVQNADLDMDNPTLVHLVLTDVLTSGQTYTLDISGIQDLQGNVLTDGSLSFEYIEVGEAAVYDILINEFFPDKSPQIGLPDAEFIELYNPTDQAFDLEGFGIADSNLDFVPLPSFVLQAKSYLILCDASAAAQYAPFGDVVAVSLPALNDSGDAIVLQNADGVEIHSLRYTKDWISDVEKQEGGWSYELKNPGSPCAGSENWDASENPAGGTPGIENSLFDFAADNTAPSMVQVLPQNDTEIRVLFSENILNESVLFTIDNNTTIAAYDISDNEAYIMLDNSLQSGVTYTLTATNVRDCLGNTNENTSATFLLPEAAVALDIVVNEILFDPVSGGVDFVEFYNRSAKIINMQGLEILNTQNGQSSFVENDYLLLPDSFVVFTESPANILANYTVSSPDALVANDLPGFSNDAGNITLVGNGTNIDAFDYTEEMHYSFLDNSEGVSLERINPEETSNDANNWHSAASTVGYATPTAQNSQFYSRNTISDAVFSLPYSTFSPDGDGYQDFLVLEYATERADQVVNIKIFDSEGRFVKDLIRNASLATSGTITWDGADADGRKARMGIYILWIELFDSEGNTSHFKETCVLANRL